MEQRELTVVARTTFGKGAARKLRAQDLVPAIFYGPHVKATVPVSVSHKDLRHVMRGDGASILKLKSDDKVINGKMAMIKSEEIDPLSRKSIHVDFYEVRMDEEVKVFVLVKVVGKALGVAEGGILDQVTRELEIRCLPTNIPKEIEVDVSSLDIGQSLHVSDITLPQGVKVLGDVDYTLAAVVLPAKEEEVAAPVPAEGEVPVAVEGETPAEGKPAEEGAADEKKPGDKKEEAPAKEK